MNSALPLLGVAIPLYKRPDTLRKLLESIPASVNITVSDNGAALSESFRSEYSHVNFLRQYTILPVLENWNRAAVAINTQWIIMPGDDDLYYPHSFETIERVIRNNPAADIIFFGHRIIDENDQVKETWKPEAAFLRPPHGFEKIRLGARARPPSIVFRSELYRQLGGFNEKFRVTAGDNDFYQRASLIGNVLFTPDVVSGYRVWSSGSTMHTIATSEWMKEIDLWCDSIQEFSAVNTTYRYTNTLRDEIYLANMRAGIKVLRERGQYGSAWRHFLASRYPYRASPLAQAKLFAQLLLPRAK